MKGRGTLPSLSHDSCLLSNNLTASADWISVVDHWPTRLKAKQRMWARDRFYLIYLLPHWVNFADAFKGKSVCLVKNNPHSNSFELGRTDCDELSMFRFMLSFRAITNCLISKSQWFWSTLGRHLLVIKKCLKSSRPVDAVERGGCWVLSPMKTYFAQQLFLRQSPGAKAQAQFGRATAKLGVTFLLCIVVIINL